MSGERHDETSGARLLAGLGTADGVAGGGWRLLNLCCYARSNGIMAGSLG